MHPNTVAPTPIATLLLAVLVSLGTAACGGPATPGPDAAAPSPAAEPAATEATDAMDAMDATDPAAIDEEAAALAAREQELAAQEAELAMRQKELELAQREAELAKREAAARTATAPKTASTPKPAAAAPVAPTAAAAPAPAAPPPPPVTVPAGTQLSVKLNSGYSTKTTALGETVNAELASDLVVDGRVVARAGAPISGSVTEVTSGSKKIGAVPALKIDFTQLVAADGKTLPVAIRINQKGQSEKGRDTAKIAGGTAAGAVIGHQIDDDKGRVIGGVLGGAAGAIAAQKTGTEVELAAGTVLPANVRTAFTYTGR